MCGYSPAKWGCWKKKTDNFGSCPFTFTTNVPKYFWRDAILIACYLINHMPSRVLLYKTPFDLLSQSNPNSRFSSELDLRVFGCSAFVHIHDHNHGKFETHSLKCVFLGYFTTQKFNWCYSPEKWNYFIS